MAISYKQGSSVEHHSIYYKHSGLAEPEGHASLEAILVAGVEWLFYLDIVEGLNVGSVAERGDCPNVADGLSDYFASLFEESVSLLAEALGQLAFNGPLDNHERRTGQSHQSHSPAGHEG